MSELHGTTLKVYLHIIRSGRERIGVRELMRELNMKTPSHAHYHLEKLVSLGLLEKKYGDYYIIKNVKIDYLREFILIGRNIVPKFLFYTIFFTIILIFSIIFRRPFEFYWYLTVILTSTGTIISLYETIRSFRKLRF
jgi:hypothetical protein